MVCFEYFWKSYHVAYYSLFWSTVKFCSNVRLTPIFYTSRFFFNVVKIKIDLRIEETPKLLNKHWIPATFTLWN